MWANYKPECCIKCGKELCSNCTETFRTVVTKVSRSEKRSDQTTHWSMTTKYQDHTGLHCPACAEEAVKQLQGMGLIAEKPTTETVSG